MDLDKLACLFNLGNAPSRRLEQINNKEDLDGMTLAYSQATKSPIGLPVIHFRAARAWAKYTSEYSPFTIRSSLCY